MGDLGRRGAVGEHVVDQLLDAITDDHQRIDAIGVTDGLRQVHQIHTLQGKQVALGNYATQQARSEEHTSELQSLMRISYAVFCLKKKTHSITTHLHKTIPEHTMSKQMLIDHERTPNT